MPILDYRKGTVLSPAGHDCIREALMLSEFYNVAEGIGARELLRPLGRARQTCKDRSSGAIRRCGQPCWVCGRERVASIDLFLVRTVAFQQLRISCSRLQNVGVVCGARKPDGRVAGAPDH